MLKIIESKVVIVYSSNYWLYQGIKSSLKGLDVFHKNDTIIDCEKEKTLFVDGNILYEGKSEKFISFINSNYIDRIVWIKGCDTGMVYPLWATGDRIININKSRDEFTRVLRSAAMELSMHGVSYYERLSPTEALIMNYLAQGYSIEQISFVTERSQRTLYQHRATILRKLGYKSPAFMQAIFLNYGSLMWTNRRLNMASMRAAS